MGSGGSRLFVKARLTIVQAGFTFGLTMNATIKINGQERKVTNTLSGGPGCEPTTYELTGGDYVYRVGNVWKLQVPGQYAVVVTLEVPARGESIPAPPAELAADVDHSRRVVDRAYEIANVRRSVNYGNVPKWAKAQAAREVK